MTKKDTSKLVKKIVTGKDGKKHTVWVKVQAKTTPIKYGDRVKLPSGKTGKVIELSNNVGSDGSQEVIVKIANGKVATTVKKVIKV